MAGDFTEPAAWIHPPEFPQLCAFFAQRSPQPLTAVQGPSHIVRYVNPAFCALVDVPRTRLVGRRFADAVPGAASKHCTDLLDRAFHSATHEVLPEQPHDSLPGVYWTYSAWPILGADSKPFGVALQVTDASETANFRVQLVALNQALLVSSVKHHELTERAEALSMELREAARLAALGTLATGIGHDLGNLLLPVRMHLDVIEQEALAAPFQRDLAAIRASFNHLQRLANGLKLLAADPRRGPPNPVTHFNQWWPDIRPLIRGALPIGINFEEHLPGPGERQFPAVAIHPTTLAQILYNLAQNAGEALAAHPGAAPGRVRIAAVSEPETRRVRITVSDNGPGMTAEVLRRCTEPYFTTKTRRISTGMGLSIVKGLIEGAGGSLTIASSPGQGAAFTVDLPAAPLPPSPPPRPLSPVAATAGPGEAAEGRDGFAAGGGDGQGAACRAAVTVNNPRASAFLVWAARSLGAEAHTHDPLSPPDADLWIVEPREGLMGCIREFILGVEHAADAAALSSRHVIIYGEPGEPALAPESLGPLASSLAITGPLLAPPQIRILLERALGELRAARD